MIARVDALWMYPVKGCRGFSTPAATLASTGLELDGIGDREWVVVDDKGEFLSQRELPKMSQIQTRFTGESLRLTAPGMLQLDVPFESEGDVIKVRVWNDEVAAVTQGRHCGRMVLAISRTAVPTRALRSRGVTDIEPEVHGRTPSTI